MPGFLLHAGAIISCADTGLATPLAPYPRVLVNGMPIVTQTTPYVVAGCQAHNVSATWLRGASRVFANGVPVLLFDSQGVCAPVTPELLVPKWSQTRVTGT